nr:uncharacterized protein LOC124816782 [Hydra vulgaris]
MKFKFTVVRSFFFTFVITFVQVDNKEIFSQEVVQDTNSNNQSFVNRYNPCTLNVMQLASIMIAKCSSDNGQDTCQNPPCYQGESASSTQCVYFHNVFNYPTGLYCTTIANLLYSINTLVSYYNCC